MSFEGGVAGEWALAVAADVAVHACVDLHVLLQGLLGLEALCTQQTEHRHVSPWRKAQKERRRRAVISVRRRRHGALSGETGSLQLCVRPRREKLLSKSKLSLPKPTPLKARRRFKL